VDCRRTDVTFPDEVATTSVGNLVVGGFEGERELKVYDPTLDRSPPPSGLTASSMSLAATLTTGLRLEVQAYDSASDRWVALAPPPTPRGALAIIVLEGRIHAVGAIGWGGRNTPAHEAYDLAINKWIAWTLSLVSRWLKAKVVAELGKL
jgi:hypothetical protein